jgi:predicted house-cleaning noncanonical NTP pyrophosphatase (MazG superfamily)
LAKLVRDRIPDIIRASGRVPVITTLTEGDYRAALYDKLREEVAELLEAQTPDAVVEEAADILEVLIAIAAGQGATPEHVLDVAQRKRTERGAFELRLSLDAVVGDPAGL